MSLFWGTVGRRWLWPNTGLCTEFGEYFPEEEVKLSCECLRIDSSASSGWCIVCWLLLWATVGFLDDATWARFVFKPPSCPIRISTMLSNLKFLACSKIWTEPSPPQSPPPPWGQIYFIYQTPIQTKNCSALHFMIWSQHGTMKNRDDLNTNRALTQAL